MLLHKERIGSIMVSEAVVLQYDFLQHVVGANLKLLNRPPVFAFAL